ATLAMGGDSGFAGFVFRYPGRPGGQASPFVDSFKLVKETVPLRCSHRDWFEGGRRDALS
ncbi:hypothetical protein ACEE76_09425, partial [Streptococcus hyovaginalis]